MTLDAKNLMIPPDVVVTPGVLVHHLIGRERVA
jgi:hypothetical protein